MTAGVDPARDAPTAPDWSALAAVMRGCPACPELAAGRTQVVVGDAPSGAELLLLGEAPGAREDLAGRPFVGRSGQYLDGALLRAGLPRDRVAVLNVLKCRPPGNRAPTRVEALTCRPWLERQIEVLDPLLVVTLGLTAMHWALGRGATLSSARGRLHAFDGRPLLATYHPAAAIRVGGTGPAAVALQDDLSEAVALLPRLRVERRSGWR